MAKSSTSGQGRPKGATNKATRELKEIAQGYAPAALKELARLSVKAESEQARVAAIKELLDRAYGKAPQAVIPQNEDGTPYEALGTGNLSRLMTFLLQREAEGKRKG